MPFLERFDVVFDNLDKQGPGLHRFVARRTVLQSSAANLGIGRDMRPPPAWFAFWGGGSSTPETSRPVPFFDSIRLRSRLHVLRSVRLLFRDPGTIHQLLHRLKKSWILPVPSLF